MNEIYVFNKNGWINKNIMGFKLFSKENKVRKYRIPKLTLASFQGQGKREYQEDDFWMSEKVDIEYIREKGFLAVVADGMGGMGDGDKISKCVVKATEEFFLLANPEMKEEEFLKYLILNVNDEAKYVQSEINNPEAGSTLVAVNIRENRLYFASLGDSHIYLYRKGELTLLNQEHNQDVKLLLAYAKGDISREEYEDVGGKANLNSFVGIDDITKQDLSVKPITLEPEDMIILMSDGVFNTIPESEIKLALVHKNPYESVQILGQSIEQINNPKQDNYTGVIIRYE